MQERHWCKRTLVLPFPQSCRFREKSLSDLFRSGVYIDDQVKIHDIYKLVKVSSQKEKIEITYTDKEINTVTCSAEQVRYRAAN